VQAYFRRVAASLGPVTVSFAVRFGEPAEQIVEEAKTTRATLIAMASHRRTGIARIVKGSVAERVERTTTVPVMLVQYGA
jgi:nucleotide-binding universal stress UspA family protein